MSQPLGRSRDFLPLPNGGALSPSRIELGLREVEGLALYRVVQQSKDRVVVYFAPLAAETSELRARLEHQCGIIFPPEVFVTIVPMDQPVTGNEKWRVIQALP
jgi:hypothetical protein